MGRVPPDWTDQQHYECLAFIRKHLSPEERLQCTDTGLRPPSSYFPRFDVEDQRSCFGRDDGLVGTEREDGMANYSLDGLGWLEDESELDLDLGHYHTTERAEAPTVATPRRSFRRNLSLSSLRRNSITPLHSQSALSRLNTPSSQYDFKPTSPHGSRFAHRPNESVASVDPRATWINDPAARQKLRNVASAQFGLAVSHTSERGSIERPMTSPRPVQYGGRTFFADDTPSLSNDEGDSQDELETLRDPKTPDEAVFQHDRKRETMINEHISPRPHAVHSYTEPCMRPSPLDDEMTIHMTLTRPDLRSPGNETTAATSSIVQSIAPAQHTASPTMNNSTSIWDSLPPVEESKVRRLWNRLKNR